MMKNWGARCLPFLMALSFLAGTASGARAADVGRQMEQEYGVVRDDSGEGREFNAMVDRVSNRIVDAVNESTGKNFRLKSATILGGRDSQHDKVINAFALPDGRIYVTLGLLRALRDSRSPDDELAFVIGHETTHVVQKHGSRQQQKAIQAGLLGILLGAATGSQAVGQAAGVAGGAYVSHYGREDEYRADKGGLVAMERAGYEPDAAVTMLRRLQQKGEEDNRFVNGLFGSHPLTGNRIKRVQQMAGNLDAGRAVDSGTDEDDDRPRKKR